MFSQVLHQYYQWFACFRYANRIWLSRRLGLNFLISKTMLPTGSKFALHSPRRYLAISWDIFDCHDGGVSPAGIQWTEARVVADHLTVLRTVLYNKELSTQYVNGTKIKKPALKSGDWARWWVQVNFPIPSSSKISQVSDFHNAL